MKGCGETFTYLKEENVTVTMECGILHKGKTYLCPNCSSNHGLLSKEVKA